MLYVFRITLSTYNLLMIPTTNFHARSLCWNFVLYFWVTKLGIDLIGEFVFEITQKVTVKSRSIRLSTDWKNLSLILMFQCRSFFEEERHACMILKYTESKSVRDSITLFLFSNNKYNVIKIYRYFCQNFLFYNFFSREREIGCWKRTAIEWHISY